LRPGAHRIASAVVGAHQVPIVRSAAAEKLSGAIAEPAPAVIYAHAQVIRDPALAVEVAALRAELAAATQRQAIAAPTEKDLHGVSAEDLAAIVARRNSGGEIEG
jgi:hypothetical protein